MIKIISDEINDFLEFLDTNYHLQSNIYFHFLEDSECIEIPDRENKYSYAITIFEKLDKEPPNIYVALDIPEDEDILHVIGHEYAHVYQWENNMELNEDEANNIADKYVMEFNCEIRQTIEECKDCRFCEKGDK